MDDQMRALVCLKSALILYFEKNEARSKGGLHPQKPKKLPPTGNRGIFLKKHYEKTSIAPKNSYLQIFLRLSFCFKYA